MAGNTISLTMSMDDKDVVAKLQKQIDLQGKQIEKLKETAKASKDAGKEADNTGSAMLKSMNAVERAISLVVDRLNAAYEAQVKLQKAAKDYARENEDLNKAFENQSGLKGEKLAKALSMQETNAVNAGVSIDHAKRVARQLNSSGMDPMEASGEGLKAILDIQAATNQVGEDPEKISKAYLGYLASQGMPKTGANVREVGSRIFTLFQGTNVQGGALDPLSKVASAFNGYMNSKEQMAVLANAVENFTPEEASTGMRNMVMALTSSKTEKSKVDALKSLGLTPDQVDLTGKGENITQALRTFKGAIGNAKDPAMVDSYLAQFFGKELVPLAKQLMNNVDVIEKNIALQGDTSQFDEAAGVNKSGLRAADARLEAQEQLQVGPLYDRQDQLLKQRRIMERQAGASETDVQANDAVYENMKWWGIPADKAFDLSRGRVSPDNIRAQLDQNTGRDPQMRENNGLLQEQTSLLRSIDSKLGNGGAPSSPVMQQGRKE